VLEGVATFHSFSSFFSHAHIALHSSYKFSLTASKELLLRLLTCIEKEILPQTIEAVEEGNKVFGAAILKDAAADEWPLVVAATNHETVTCLFHGEVQCLYTYSVETPADGRPDPSECIFLSTHEPCCMCVSSIVWSGFTRVYYLFGYQDTKTQGIRK
jgi:tRNA(Arg) A34 adenosine deaminase TadA